MENDILQSNPYIQDRFRHNNTQSVAPPAIKINKESIAPKMKTTIVNIDSRLRTKENQYNTIVKYLDNNPLEINSTTLSILDRNTNLKINSEIVLNNIQNVYTDDFDIYPIYYNISNIQKESIDFYRYTISAYNNTLSNNDLIKINNLYYKITKINDNNFYIESLSTIVIQTIYTTDNQLITTQTIAEETINKNVLKITVNSHKFTNYDYIQLKNVSSIPDINDINYQVWYYDSNTILIESDSFLTLLDSTFDSEYLISNAIEVKRASNHGISTNDIIDIKSSTFVYNNQQIAESTYPFLINSTLSPSQLKVVNQEFILEVPIFNNQLQVFNNIELNNINLVYSETAVINVNNISNDLTEINIQGNYLQFFNTNDKINLSIVNPSFICTTFEKIQGTIINIQYNNGLFIELNEDLTNIVNPTIRISYLQSIQDINGIDLNLQFDSITGNNTYLYQITNYNKTYFVLFDLTKAYYRTDYIKLTVANNITATETLLIKDNLNNSVNYTKEYMSNQELIISTNHDFTNVDTLYLIVDYSFLTGSYSLIKTGVNTATVYIENQFSNNTRNIYIKYYNENLKISGSYQIIQINQVGQSATFKLQPLFFFNIANYTLLADTYILSTSNSVMNITHNIDRIISKYVASKINNTSFKISLFKTAMNYSEPDVVSDFIGFINYTFTYQHPRKNKVNLANQIIGKSLKITGKTKDYIFIGGLVADGFEYFEAQPTTAFGGSGVQMSYNELKEIGYPNSNYYKYKLHRKFKNIKLIRMISFQSEYNNIFIDSSNNNFKVMIDNFIIEITVEEGYYRFLEFAEILQQKLNQEYAKLFAQNNQVLNPNIIFKVEYKENQYQIGCYQKLYLTNKLFLDNNITYLDIADETVNYTIAEPTEMYLSSSIASGNYIFTKTGDRLYFNFNKDISTMNLAGVVELHYPYEFLLDLSVSNLGLVLGYNKIIYNSNYLYLSSLIRLDNYALLVCPNLNTNSADIVFSKIYLTDFVSSNLYIPVYKNFEGYSKDEVDEIEFKFYDKNMTDLFNFNYSEHSMLLEIEEYIDTIKGIQQNTKYMNY